MSGCAGHGWEHHSTIHPPAAAVWLGKPWNAQVVSTAGPTLAVALGNREWGTAYSPPTETQARGTTSSPLLEGAPQPELAPMPRPKDGGPEAFELPMPRKVADVPSVSAAPAQPPSHMAASPLLAPPPPPLLPTPPTPPATPPVINEEGPVLAPELALTKTGPANVELGGVVEHTITLHNRGRKEATQVVVVDHLPPELTVEQAPEGTEVVGREIHWRLGVVPADATRTLRVRAKAVQASPRVLNRVSASSREGSGATASAALRIIAPQAMKLEVYDMVDPVPLGEETEYLIRVSNKGTGQASQLQLEITCPSELKPIALLGGPRDVRLDQTLRFPVGDLLPGAVKSFRLKTQALKAGDSKITVKLIAADPDQELLEEETTSIQSGR